MAKKKRKRSAAAGVFQTIIALLCLLSLWIIIITLYSLPIACITNNEDNDIDGRAGAGGFEQKLNGFVVSSSIDNTGTKNRSRRPPLLSSSHNKFSSSHTNNDDDDVVQFDHHVLANIQATYNGARSYIEWLPKSLFLKKNNNVDLEKDIHKQFTVLPLSATVDRRPLIVRKQLLDYEKQQQHRSSSDNRGDTSSLLPIGCAISSTTFVSNLEYQNLKKSQKHTNPASCHVCFQFSNGEDMKNFVSPSNNHEVEVEEDETTATKCFSGKATITARFANWQQKDERFAGFGYPWTVDCTLPSGIKELTCKEITKLEREIISEEHGHDDGVQRIYFKTEAMLDAKVGSYNYQQQFIVHSLWPWGALMSHDDDRSKIAASLSETFDDTTSAFVPKKSKELKLMHVEGPVYDKIDSSNTPASLKSMNVHPNSRGGLHPRLLPNLFHLMRNAPGSTHMIAVVDGQAKRSYENLLALLNMEVGTLYPTHGHIFEDLPRAVLESLELIPISEMSQEESSSHGQTSYYSNNNNSNNNMTLMELLRYRQIRLTMVPILTPSLAFAKSVCGGQYPFATYLAARYAADYHAIMFIDGDTAIVEKSSTTLQDVLYNRFFSSKEENNHSSLKNKTCAGHRLRLIEQYVREEDETTEQLLACTNDLYSNQAKWDYAMKNCHLKEGHIVARTDSIYAFSVHHPDTLPEYLPRGVEDCITPGNREDDVYFLRAESEFVQLHLRDRERKVECACFVNQE